MEEKTYLAMKFRDAQGKIRTLNLQNPKEALTANEVQTAMELIVDKDIFEYGLVSAESAAIITRIEEEVY